MIILLIIISYLIGSIPSSVWISKYFYKIDIRDHGSKNAGATNVFRVLGWKAALPVLILDIFKGTLSTALSADLSCQLFLMTACVLGHIFPIFEKFNGGKGVSTMLGSFLWITPISCLIILGIFISVLFKTKISSVSSLISTISVPFVFWLTNQPNMLIFYSIFSIILISWTHKKNIERIARNEEKELF